MTTETATPATTETAPRSVELGHTSTLVYLAVTTVNHGQGCTAREVRDHLRTAADKDMDMGHVRNVLRNLRDRHEVIEQLPQATGERVIRFVGVPGAMDWLAQGELDKAQRKANKTTPASQVEPMSEEAYAQAAFAVYHYDTLVSRSIALKTREGKKEGGLQEHTWRLEGDSITGTVDVLTAELRKRRNTITSLPEFRAAKKLAMMEVVGLLGGAEDDEAEDDAVAAEPAA